MNLVVKTNIHLKPHHCSYHQVIIPYMTIGYEHLYIVSYHQFRNAVAMYEIWI